MKTLTKLVVPMLLSLVFLSGCQSPGVQQLSADTYVIQKSSAAGMFTNMAKLRGDTIAEANAFAASKGKVAVAVSAREHIPEHGFPSYEYQFRLVDQNDPAARGVSLQPRPDVVIERNENINAKVTTNDQTPKSFDLYTELKKLDALRKDGLITDAEYDAQKKILLEKTK